MDEQRFAAYLDTWIPKHKDEIIGSLMELLEINSVGGEATQGKPFGREVDRALRWIQNKADSCGIKTKNVDGYAVHAEIGAGEEMAMALTHVDIVPVGSGWSKKPLGEIHQGVIYGRGTQDDKGPTVACLYALQALAESGAPLKRRVRHVVGGNEESGFRCVRHYFQVEEQPTYGFSPDAMFPLVFAEKGTMGVQAEFLLSETVSGTADCLLVEISGGERPNIVAEKGMARLKVSQGRESEVVELLKKHVPEARERVGGPGPLELEFSWKPGFVTVNATGKAAHAASPQEGTNALAGLCLVLSGLGPGLGVAKELRFLGEAGDIYGKGLDIASRDEISGDLTCNLGLVETGLAGGAKQVRATYNIRFPVKVSGEGLKVRAESCKRPGSVRLSVPSMGKAHYTDPESFIVKTLLRVYREETGDTSPPIAIGGGTYARVISGGVAFGPTKPGAPELAHQADERVSVDDLLQLVRIYARSLFALAV